MRERASLVSVDCFGEIDDAAKYEVGFVALGSKKFISFFPFDFYLNTHLFVIVVVGRGVVYSGGPYFLSLAFDVALDCFVRVREVLVDEAGG